MISSCQVLRRPSPPLTSGLCRASNHNGTQAATSSAKRIAHASVTGREDSGTGRRASAADGVGAPMAGFIPLMDTTVGADRSGNVTVQRPVVSQARVPT